MPRLSVLLSIVAVVAVIPGGLAGPACTRKYYQTSECIEKCNSKWGYKGSMMGTKSWGSVMVSTEDSPETWLYRACGMEDKAPAPAVKPEDDRHKKVNSNTTTAGDDPDVVEEEVQEGDDDVDDPDVDSEETSTPTSSGASTSSPTNTSTAKAAPGFMPHVTKTTSTSATPTKAPAAEELKADDKKTQDRPKTTTTITNSTPAKTTATTTTSSTPSASSKPSAPLSPEADQFLKAHNDVRAKHGASALVWSDSLASKAKGVAGKCAFQQTGDAQNLAAGSSSSFGISDAMASWMEEKSEYDSKKPEISSFTQVVWKSTKSVGCAVQSGCTGIFGNSPARFVVCEYDTPSGDDFSRNIQV
jgi:uncharacterized protein YkwD